MTCNCTLCKYPYTATDDMTITARFMHSVPRSWLPVPSVLFRLPYPG